MFYRKNPRRPIRRGHVSAGNVWPNQRAGNASRSAATTRAGGAGQFAGQLLAIPLSAKDTRLAACARSMAGSSDELVTGTTICRISAETPKKLRRNSAERLRRNSAALRRNNRRRSLYCRKFLFCRKLKKFLHPSDFFGSLVNTDQWGILGVNFRSVVVRFSKSLQ